MTKVTFRQLPLDSLLELMLGMGIGVLTSRPGPLRLINWYAAYFPRGYPDYRTLSINEIGFG